MCTNYNIIETKKKNKKIDRFCKRCNHRVVEEIHKEIDYPYFCPHCYENMYNFETYTKETNYKIKDKITVHKVSNVEGDLTSEIFTYWASRVDNYFSYSDLEALKEEDYIEEQRHKGKKLLVTSSQTRSSIN